jgi:TrmH family RNA methyltransferase
MPLAAVILVEPALPGNLGATIRVAANFGVPRVDLVRPLVAPDDSEVLRWARGGQERVRISQWHTLNDAGASFRTLVASASGRGRQNLPLVTPREAVSQLTRRGLDSAALVFGNETSGLRREDLDRCDFVVRVPTEPEFSVLNLVQSVAILLGYLTIEGDRSPESGPLPASAQQVDGLMRHLERSLFAVGFLDPENPQRILRKLRRLFGRAGVTENEVTMLRGICRQMDWAARTGPLRDEGKEGET